MFSFFGGKSKAKEAPAAPEGSVTQGATSPAQGPGAAPTPAAPPETAPLQSPAKKGFFSSIFGSSKKEEPTPPSSSGAGKPVSDVNAASGGKPPAGAAATGGEKEKQKKKGGMFSGWFGGKPKEEPPPVEEPSTARPTTAESLMTTTRTAPPSPVPGPASPTGPKALAPLDYSMPYAGVSQETRPMASPKRVQPLSLPTTQPAPSPAPSHGHGHGHGQASGPAQGGSVPHYMTHTGSSAAALGSTQGARGRSVSPVKKSTGVLTMGDPTLANTAHMFERGLRGDTTVGSGAGKAKGKVPVQQLHQTVPVHGLGKLMLTNGGEAGDAGLSSSARLSSYPAAGSLQVGAGTTPASPPSTTDPMAGMRERELTATLQDTQAQVIVLEDDVRRLRAELASAQELLQSSSVHAARAGMQRDGLRDELLAAKAKAAAAESEIEAARAALAAAQAEAGRESIRQELLLSKSQAQLSEAQGALKQAGEQLILRGRTAKAMRAEIDQLKAELADLRARSSAAAEESEAQIGVLQELVQGRDGTIAETLAHAERVSASHAALSADVAAVRQEASSAHAARAAAEEECARLRAHVSEAARRLATERAARALAERKVEALTKYIKNHTEVVIEAASGDPVSAAIVASNAASPSRLPGPGVGGGQGQAGGTAALASALQQKLSTSASHSHAAGAGMSPVRARAGATTGRAVPQATQGAAGGGFPAIVLSEGEGGEGRPGEEAGISVDFVAPPAVLRANSSSTLGGGGGAGGEGGEVGDLGIATALGPAAAALIAAGIDSMSRAELEDACKQGMCCSPHAHSSLGCLLTPSLSLPLSSCRPYAARVQAAQRAKRIEYLQGKLKEVEGSEKSTRERLELEVGTLRRRAEAAEGRAAYLQGVLKQMREAGIAAKLAAQQQQATDSKADGQGNTQVAPGRSKGGKGGNHHSSSSQKLKGAPSSPPFAPIPSPRPEMSGVSPLPTGRLVDEAQLEVPGTQGQVEGEAVQAPLSSAP